MNSETLADFVRFCEEHPTERFWQALCSWSGRNFVYLSDTHAYDIKRPDKELEDTFYREGK